MQVCIVDLTVVNASACGCARHVGCSSGYVGCQWPFDFVRQRGTTEERDTLAWWRLGKTLREGSQCFLRFARSGEATNGQNGAVVDLACNRVGRLDLSEQGRI